MNFMLTDAYLNLKSQGLKTFFSLLSMIVGLAAFYVLLTVKCQADVSKTLLLNEMGAHRFVAIMSDQNIMLNTLPQLKNKLKNKTISPYELVYKPTYYQGKILEGQLVLVSPDFFQLLNLSADSGLLFTHSDNQLNLKKMIIGSQVAQQMQFRYDAPYIQVEQQGFEVVGVLEAVALNPLFDFDLNNAILLPLSSIQRFDFQGIVHHFIVEDNSCSFAECSAEFTNIINAQYGVHPLFFKYPGLFVQALEKQAQERLALLTAITVITLILGMVGIIAMQWMGLLARRSELGMRLSMGATLIELASLFLLENILLVLASGGIGVIAGIIASIVINSSSSVASAAIFFWFPILGVAILSCIIGIISGIPIALLVYKSRPANLLAFS